MEHGALIEDGDTIIHHCNMALATVDWGTAEVICASAEAFVAGG
jgi:methylthioribose-1-phosphate isomerase